MQAELVKCPYSRQKERIFIDSFCLPGIMKVAVGKGYLANGIRRGMNRMKKLIARIGAVSLAVLLALGAVSCAKGEGTAANYETFKTAVEKTSALKDLNMSAAIDVSAKAPDETANIGLDMVLQAKDLEENPQMNFSMDFDMAGEKQAMAFYYADGVAYINQGGVKQKAEISVEEIKEMLGDQTAEMELTIPEESEMKNAEYKQENGNVIVTMKVTAEEIQELLGSLSASMSELGDASVEGMMDMMSWKDITIKVTINQEGYIAQMDLTAGLSLSAEGESGDIDISAVIKLVDPGKDFTVNAPSDLDSYEAA